MHHLEVHLSIRRLHRRSSNVVAERRSVSAYGNIRIAGIGTIGRRTPGRLRVTIEILPVSIEDKPVLANLLELYRHDFSEFDGRDLGEQGRFGYAYLDQYWTEPDRHPFFVRVDGRLAGFALLRILPKEDGCETHVSEFFVVRKYRRQGVGEAVARRLFDMFPGQWVVAQADRNLPAQRFWRTVIERYTGGAFTERHDDDRGQVVQQFVVPYRA